MEAASDALKIINNRINYRTAKGFRPYGSDVVATGQGRYGLKRAWSHLAAHEKKHHTLGRAATKVAKHMTGLGMYTGQGSYEGGDGVVTNSLVDNPGLEGVPTFSSEGDETGAITITHREFIREIYGPTAAFENHGFALNPGIEATFPFLAQIAGNYEEYEFNQLLFTFRSTTAEIGTSTTGQVGTMIMATNYNPSNKDFESKFVMMGYDAAQSGKVTSDLVHGVECDNSKLSGTDEKYVRTGPAPIGTDLKDYDHGRFQIAVSNSPAGFADNSLGELWVSYSVTLRKPKLATGLGNSISRSIYMDTFLTWFVADARAPWAIGGGYLSGQQNSIDLAFVDKGKSTPPTANNSLGTVNVSAVAAAPIAVGAGQFGIVLPAHLSGHYEFTVQVNANQMEIYDTPVMITCGNVAPVYDLARGDGTGGSICDYVQSCKGSGPTNSLEGCWLSRFHFKVTEATSGHNNVIIFDFLNDGTTGTGSYLTAGAQFDSTVLEIKEYNATFSYAAQNVGDRSSCNIYVNESGVVVSPADP